MSKPKFAVLGIGRMGAALAGTFLDQKYDVTIWNRTRSKCEPLASRGARVAESVLEAIAQADVIIGVVSDYPTSDQLLRVDEVTRALRGKVFIQLTTGTPAQGRDGAEWARQHGIRYLDGAIMNTPNLVGQSGCTILYSGESEVFEKYREHLLALGGTVHFIGTDPGHASALDSALLAFMWGPIFSLLHGLSISAAEKIPLEVFADLMKTRSMAFVDFIVREIMQRVQDGRFAGDATTTASLATCQMAMDHWIHVCKLHGIRTGLPDAFNEVFRAALAAGHAEDDLAMLYRFMKG